MPSRRGVWCLVAAALYLPAAWGQLIQTVIVGANGSFFSPNSISVVNVNATVRFVFSGMQHSIVQASFDNPCLPLSGGFSSGVAGNTSTGSPIWDLQVTNVSGPIWYYCANTLPSFHCAAGMVGVINTPSAAMFDQYLAASKNVTLVPPVFPSQALSGQGALATAAPLVPSGSSPSSTSTSSSSITQSTSSTRSPTTAVTHSASSNNGAIIGGSVGGGVAFVAAVILLAWFCVGRRRHASGEGRNTREFFDYNVKSHPGDHTDARVTSNWDPTPTDYHRDAQIWTQPSHSNMTDSTSNPPTTFTPQRRDTVGRTYRVTNDTASTSTVNQPTDHPPPMSQMKEQKSFLSMQPPTTPSTSQNIHTLAREVAAVMMQNTLDPRSRLDNEVSAPPSYANHH